MDKPLIQGRTNKLLERAENPKEFVEGSQELLKYFVDEEATKNYRRIVPDTGKFYGVPKPILGAIASEMGKSIQKEPAKAEGLLKVI